jgi:hypothetical protein
VIGAILYWAFYAIYGENPTPAHLRTLMIVLLPTIGIEFLRRLNEQKKG